MKKALPIATAFLWTFLAQLSLALAAQEKIDPFASPPLQEINFAWEFFKMVLILLAVCAFAYGLLRWILPRSHLLSGSDQSLFQIVQRFVLEPKKVLYIVRIGEEYHLIGTSEQSMSYLAALPADKVKEMLKKVKSPGVFAERKNFWNILEGLREHLPGRDSTPDPGKKE